MKNKRYWHSCVGYGIQTECGQKYATGRIEVHDIRSKHGYAIDEYNYWIPLEVEDRWRTFWDSLKTDLPMFISGGNEIFNITFEKLEQLNGKTARKHPKNI